MDATTAFTLATGIRVPGQSEARAAWLGLPVETRDRIGTLAVDHMLQMFLLGDDEAAHRQPLRGYSAAEGEAQRRADNVLDELWHLIERALPELFGTETTGPAWARPADQ
ncbi:hypothetical protein [Methylobacterium sp. WL120]|uniref:hypothetical protein n=1 Tax=Methylobacterium sp. WL120 TaxID=2603887 RepID=UPI0011CB41EF|nr:hypothetical protein [Methylobacterium sp. WL120]TXM69974.1 hypothetical protein FV229_03815 [Methylobacterium sp. WL120]